MLCFPAVNADLLFVDFSRVYTLEECVASGKDLYLMLTCRERSAIILSELVRRSVVYKTVWRQLWGLHQEPNVAYQVEKSKHVKVKHANVGLILRKLQVKELLISNYGSHL